MERYAVISNCGSYRYSLTRRWSNEPTLMWVMLNPSTADAFTDDPTIRRCVGFAKGWGYGEIVVANLFALRTPSPAEMKVHPDPVGPKNDYWLKRLSAGAWMTIAAWGNHGSHLDRGTIVRPILRKLHHMGLTEAHQPKHPLYLPRETKAARWYQEA